MCGGFTCSKNALTALNILYILVAFILIGVAVYGQASARVTNLPIIGGILACGIFLILISILGLIGAIKHHQVMLFFYMLILFLLFLVQFSVACACLAVNMDQQQLLAKQGWEHFPCSMKAEVQESFTCCGFTTSNSTDVSQLCVVDGHSPSPMSHPACTNEISCCQGAVEPCTCRGCMAKLQNTINYAFKLCGGIGLFFSFTEVVAAVVAYRYRNLMATQEKAASAIIPKNLYTY